jgi:hypothetical protein
LDHGADSWNPSSSWKRVAEAAVSFAEVSLDQPVPLGAITATLERGTGARSQEQLWTALHDDLDRITHTSLPNTHSLRTLLRLFESDDEGFGQLKAIVSARRMDELVTWVTTAPTSEQRLGRLLDDAGHAIDPKKPPIHGTHRRKVLRDLAAVVRQTRAFASLGTTLAVGGSTDQGISARKVTAAALALATRCAKEFDSLEADNATSAPERPLIAAVLDALRPLRDWHAVSAHVYEEGPA